MIRSCATAGVRSLLVLSVSLCLTVPSAGKAQGHLGERTAATETPEWMLGWSPLARLLDQPRVLTRAPPLPGLLVAAAPRIGLSWAAGNPAGLATEVRTSRAQLRLSGGTEDGRYRRPLDHMENRALQFSGLAWQPSGRGAAAGRIVIGQADPRPSSSSGIQEPYASNPLVVTDTSIPDMRHIRARLEGGLAGRFGGWTAGLAVGIEVADRRTHGARFQRIGRISTPGVAVGVRRKLPLGLILAALGRWLGGSEKLTLSAQPANGVVYLLEGLTEPPPREVGPPTNLFIRLIDRKAFATGLTLAGSTLGADWVAFWQREWRKDEHFSELSADPPTDDWDADGHTLGAAVQRQMLGERLLLTGWARWNRLNGHATRFDLRGFIFEAEEDRLLLRGDARLTLPESPWRAGLVLELLGQSRLRRDFVAETRAEIDGWTPGGALEVGRDFGTTAISLGFSAAFYSASSTIPDPRPMGEVYQTLIAPELSMYATPATAWRGGLSVRRNVGSLGDLLLRVSRESLSTRGSDNLPFGPSGDRTLWNASLILMTSF